MSTEQWIAIILVLIPAVASIVVGVMNRQKIEALDVKVDGRLTQLLDVTATAQHAEGMVAGGMDSAAIEAIISNALSKALLVPPPPGMAALAKIRETGEDTNQRVREVQDTAAEVADALAIKEQGSRPSSEP